MKKINLHPTAFKLLAGVLLVANCVAKADTVKPDTTIIIKLKMLSPGEVHISKAALKYNKKLAFSFTLDDGYRSAYATAFPLLNGGTISPSIPDEYHSDSGGDGGQSSGLFYTDGCGNKIPFRLAVALNSGIVYDHPENRARLSWPEVTTLYNNGWDILNHGYHHLTKAGTDYDSEVAKNISEVKDKLNFQMTHFVVPGGEHPPRYEHEYEQDAIKRGALTVANYTGKGPAINADSVITNTPVIYARDLYKSNGNTVDLKHVDTLLNKIDSLTKLPHAVWYNAFTHNTGNGNLWTISLVYPEFKYLMKQIAAHHGAGNHDDIWVAPVQQVYEYLWLRDRIAVTATRKANIVTIKLTVPKVPAEFRNRSISLNVDARSQFMVENPAKGISGNGKTAHNLVNVDLN